MKAKKYQIAIIALLWVAVLSPVIFLTTIFSLISYGHIGYIPDFEELENPKSNLATEVISADGVVLGKFYIENRTVVKFEDLSPNLVNALVATEDIRFYKHSGIDARGLARVLFKTVILRKNTGGGSTITQQLAKNLYRMREQTEGKKKYKTKIGKKWGVVIMKFQEWVTAALLEKRYTKEEIMVMYFNTVTYGHNAFGIKSAANIFYNTSPNELKIEEASVLVGLLKAPTYYSPLRNPNNSTGRRNTVFNQIQKYQTKLEKKTGWKPLSEAQFDSLRALPLKTNYQKQTHNEGLATYFREYLRGFMNAKKPVKKNYAGWQTQQYLDDSTLWFSNPLYGWCNKNFKPSGEKYNLYKDGLKIYTTINSRMQGYAEASVAEHLGTGDKPLQDVFFEHIKNRDHSPYHYKLKKKQVENIIYSTMKRTERYRALKNGHLDSTEIYANFNKPVRMSIFTWNGYKDTLMSPMDSIYHYKKYLRAGFVSIEPKSGHVKAYVGGIDYNHFKYDHVMVARRQVGSTFKPFVYTLAMMPGGYSPCYKVNNVSVTFEVPKGNNKMKPYTPKFSKSKFDGQKISLKLGLALSLNQISAWVMKQYKPESVIEIVRSLGVKSPLDPVFSLCVGAGEVKLIEMGGAYCAYANKGVYTSPIFVTKVEDKHGNIIATFNSQKNQAFDEHTAYRVLQLMRGVIQFGTSTRMWRTYKLRNVIAGKTGTTNDNSDGWFMGITPKLVSGAWVGGEERGIRFSSTRLGQGANMALPIWALYMQKVYADETLPYSTKDKFEKPKIDDDIITDCDDFDNNDYDIINNGSLLIIDDDY